jgi:hypothetical protein
MVRKILRPMMLALVAMIGATLAPASAGAQSISVDQVRAIANTWTFPEAQPVN